ncbi:hypothetical protein Pcinc_004522 [Petrolisthes cinctipes]|uniref:Uncharacterized protein n=1 Tax=Petrolisthes cinctipes TaxID=88211 RepID=A0AAE1GGN9_PETCI|nr:hypothetical protein Pcinc_004522 [Petrolisthes cinctipes]
MSSPVTPQDPRTLRSTPTSLLGNNLCPVTPPEDFAAYDLFGEFPGAASPGQVVEMKPPKPVCAMFVTGHMLYDHPFQVCHIEVFCASTTSP